MANNFLGYLVCSRKQKDFNPCWKVVTDFQDIDSEKPALIIGIKKAKEFCKSKGLEFDILSTKITDNVFWTFKKTEKRTAYERDIQSFYDYSVRIHLERIKYYYVNIFKLKYKQAKILINLLENNEGNYIYLSNGMMYFLYDDKSIMGLSLRVLKYCHIFPRKVINIIKKNPNNKIVSYRDEAVMNIKKNIHADDYTMPYFIQFFQG